MSRLVFLDFETTGLNPVTCEPIEVAAVVTDDAFEELGAFESLICPPEDCVWESLAWEMHDRSGLAKLAEQDGRPPFYVGQDLYAFLVPFADRGPLHLAGNSVHFDRGFLRVDMPRVERLFHHRHLDVSSVRMLGERVTSAPQLGGDKPHRAMADVRRSIAELKHWAKALRSAA